ncbi:hypothetical protein HKX69_29965 [Streptomyces argyrophyllae]|uniref:Uncharacterized protein n=1 Tax=Streptomyces argyrophylli TaxID=2726118 RepID=A0A6M4PQ14_9ACTN|nr:hypothetical protein [Streptomyces argyrophyllae]QJS13205.1 hypothetical protein HKX69_29965 [Streptomyces argyrophyllae]
MPHNLSKDTPEPSDFKGYLATVTVHEDRAEIKRKLMGKLTGAKDSVIPFSDVIKVVSKEPTRAWNGYVQLATAEDSGRLVAATAQAEKAIANNSRTIMFTWNQRETYAAYLSAVTAAVNAQGGHPLG